MITAAAHKHHRRIHPTGPDPAPIRIMSSNNNKGNSKMAIVESHRSMLCERNSARQNYQDHKKDPVVVHEVIPHRGATRQFPNKLYEMLAQASEEGFDDIVSWQPHGRAFLVRKPGAFVSEVMHRYYSQSKLTSYQRQLSLYGFVRITSGKDRGAYYHELFLRGRPDLLVCIERKRVKGTGSKQPASPESEPDFYTMEFCLEPGCESEASDDGEEDNEEEEARKDTATTTFNKDEVSSSTEIMGQHVLDSPSLVSEDESLEAYTASFCEEYSAITRDGSLVQEVLSAPEVMTTTDTSIPPMQRSTADLCEAEMLAEFGQDLFDGEIVPPPAAASVYALSSHITKLPCAAVKPSANVGPLRVPGQLRNAFGKGIKSTCIHTTMGADSGAIVKYIQMDVDMSENCKRAEVEYERFRKPLDKTIAFQVLDHVNWECYKTGEETVVPLLPTEAASQSPSLEECVSSWTSDDLVELATAESSSLRIASDDSTSSSAPTTASGAADLEERAAVVSSCDLLAV